MPLLKKEPVIEPVLTRALSDSGMEGRTMGELIDAVRASGIPFRSYWGVYSALKRMFEQGKIARVYEYQPVGKNRFGKRVYRYFLLMYANAGMPGIQMPGAPAVNGAPGWTPWNPWG